MSVDAKYLHFPKDIDNVPHRKLLNKVGASGLRLYVLACTRDWQIGRRQGVGIMGHFQMAIGNQQCSTGVDVVSATYHVHLDDGSDDL